MADDIDFSKQYKYSVDVHLDALDLGKAALSFGSEHWPHVSFEDWRSYAQLGDQKIHPILKATTQSGEIFTLFNCKVTGYHLSVDYVVTGDVTDNFKRIEIRFSDISEWFMPFRKLEEKISKNPIQNNRDKQLSATVKTAQQEFSLTSRPVVQIKQSGEDHIVHEHILFNFEKIDGNFSIKDTKNKTHELSTLLSILIAYPLSIVSVQVVCADERTYGVFFPAFKRIERDTSSGSFWTRCFIFKPALDDCWQTILKHYYKSEYRESLWVRLAGMQRYEGFWEYETLGYVSLLDKYVKERSKGQKKAPPKSEDVKTEKLNAALQKLAPALTVTQEQSLLSIIKGFFFHGSKLSFRQKYEYALSLTDDGILKIINLSKPDFDKIKEIRDAIAHGETPELIDSDYGRVGIVVSKITLLLTYWAFLDFGLTTDHFLKCLIQTHSPLLLRADIDHVHLARVTKTAEFFSVPRQQFENLSKIKGITLQPCFTQDSDGKIEYSEHHTSALREWYKKPVSGTVPVEEIFDATSDQIKCPPQAYIECENDRLDLVQAYFIKSA